jgi:hypothetical protein
MAKTGDTRRCSVCGGWAVLQILQGSAATLGWVDGESVPYEVPLLPMWHCEDCGDRQPLDGELEAG